MSLFENIKKDQLQARKDKDKIKVAILTTLISDAMMIGKNDGNRETTDLELIKLIKKYITNINENIKIINTNTDILITLNNEITILKSYLPNQLSGDSLIEVIDQIMTETNSTTIKDMGKVMKVLKDKYDGRYDGAVASSIVRQKLQR